MFSSFFCRQNEVRQTALNNALFDFFKCLWMDEILSLSLKTEHLFIFFDVPVGRFFWIQCAITGPDLNVLEISMTSALEILFFQIQKKLKVPSRSRGNFFRSIKHLS